MAKAIEFRPTPNVPGSAGTREKMEQRLDAAPVVHADALLEVYALLQQLHDSGTLALLRGGLGAGNKIVEEENRRGLAAAIGVLKALGQSTRPQPKEVED